MKYRKWRGGDELLNFKPEDVDIEEIAHNLSQICRFAGNTPYHYSVAEHSVIVAEMVFDNMRLVKENKNISGSLYGLLHDSAEAYIGDITRPVKQVIYSQSLARLDSVVTRAILTSEHLHGFYRLGIPSKEYRAVEKADEQIGNVECYKFYGTDHWESNCTIELRQLLCDKIQGLPAGEAAKQFLSAYDAIKALLRANPKAASLSWRGGCRFNA